MSWTTPQEYIEGTDRTASDFRVEYSDYGVRVIDIVMTGRRRSSFTVEGSISVTKKITNPKELAKEYARKWFHSPIRRVI